MIKSTLVACVYQRSTITGGLTVAENLFLNRQSGGALRPIRRALSFGARFIILDGPTAKLDGRVGRLFGKLRDLQRQGVAFLFISHHLQEVYDLCTKVTVYRDAAHFLPAPVTELGQPALVLATTFA